MTLVVCSSCHEIQHNEDVKMSDVTALGGAVNLHTRVFHAKILRGKLSGGLRLSSGITSLVNQDLAFSRIPQSLHLVRNTATPQAPISASGDVGGKEIHVCEQRFARACSTRDSDAGDVRMLCLRGNEGSRTPPGIGSTRNGL